MKKFIYEELWLMLGITTGFLVGGILEYFLLIYLSLDFSKYFIYFPTMAIGFGLGMWLGPIAWRKIYVEGVRGKKYVVKK